ncbi:MAG TPA: PDZ domain-containing protein [Allosphingosinicella sp.]|nr:PDZ domain-containing protein [Allosphingosinicella sp.]
MAERGSGRPFLLAAALAAPVLAAPARAPDAIPFRYAEARLYVPVAAAAGPLGDFILDTGAPGVMVDSGLQGRLGAATLSRHNAEGAGTGRFDVAVAGPALLSVAGVPLRVPSVETGALDRLLGPYCGCRVAGIVGAPFFRDHVVTIDFRRGRIALADPAAFHYRGAGARLKLDLSHDVPIVAGTIGLADGSALKLRLLVDLGAKANLLVATPFVAKYRLLERLGRTVEAPLGAGLGGETRYAFARLPLLRVGDGAAVTARNLVVGLSVRDTLRGGTYDALLGAQFLRNYRIIFDYSRREMILEPAPGARPDRFDRSGAFLVAGADDRGRIAVREILPGSPAAEAGLRKDDLILAVDGRPIRAWTLAALRARLAAPGSRPVAVTLRRGDEEIRATIRLRTLI